MKKYLFLIATAITLGFTSCSEEECDHIPTNGGETKSIVGNWYEEAENEEMRFGENGSFYDKYCNIRRSGETEGRWEYDSKNKKLTYTYSFMGQSQFADWTVKNLKELSFTISSTMVADHNLEKIVETYQLEVGETANILFTQAYPSYVVKSYTSNNERLASVTSNGVITAEGEKGTTYIKIETNNGNVWVKVVVGDDCLDLWYDYESLMGKDYSKVKTVLGIPSINGDDGYSYGYILSDYNDYLQELDVFLNTETGLVEEMALLLKPAVPESLILSYLKSHYYNSELLGSGYYMTCPTVENSVAVVKFDKEEKCIRFFPSSYFQWPDYVDTFGLTTSEVIERFGEFYYGVLPYYAVVNSFVETIYFNIDKTTDKVTVYQLGVKSELDSSIIHEILSSKYNCYRSDETGTQFAYRDGESKEDSKIMIVYNVTNKTVTYYDLENYVAS